MTDGKCFIVVQAATSGAWRSYLAGWHGGQDGVCDLRALPVWLGARDQALKVDKQTALQLADQFDTRYGRSEMVHHLVEELA